MRLAKATAAGWSALRDFFPRLLNIGRQLFNEIMALIFFGMAVVFTFGAHGLIQTFRSLDQNPDEFPKLLMLAFFVLLFASFGYTSFRRARRLSRQR
jgi:hypothetical protein